jgi:hypothetical protein
LEISSIGKFLLWKERFKNVDSRIFIISFTAPKDFLDWYLKYKAESVSFSYLIDLEFSEYNKTGLEIIEECSIPKNSILVTSHFENIEIHNQCEKLSVKIIPKDLVAFVPIK